MSSAPVSPAKKVRPGSAGVVGLVPRLENWNPLNGSKGGGRDAEGGRERSKRSLMGGIVEAQSHSQGALGLGGVGGGAGGGGGGLGVSSGSREKESHTHHRTFRVSDRTSALKRDDSSSASVHHNNSSRNTEYSDVTYVCDSVHLDEENNPLSPSWGRSRSHSTGTGTTSHVNDSSISTGSSGFFSRLLATPSKHLRKKNDDCTSHYRKDRSDRDSEKERDRGDEESVGSRGGGSVEQSLGYDPYLREENVHEDTAYIRSKLCLRVNVKSSSRYRLCDSNPQEEGDATWACATGVFQQSFILRGDICELEDRLVASDRLVTVVMDSRITNNNGDIRVENTNTTTDFQYSDNYSSNADKNNNDEHSEKDNDNPDIEKEKPKREVKVY